MKDIEAIGAVIDEMYSMISGPKGPRDWERQSLVFHPDARQCRTGIGADGAPWIKIMSLSDYRADTTPYFAANDFYEIEVSREIRVFGNMAQAWSVYEARTSPSAREVERRGINSIQLYKDESKGWQIVSMIWDNERAGVFAPGQVQHIGG